MPALSTPEVGRLTVVATLRVSMALEGCAVSGVREACGICGSSGGWLPRRRLR
jgi:hypothetical protein